MERTSPLLVIGSVVLACVVSFSQPLDKPTAENPAGRWVGQYTTASHSVFLVVRLKKENEKWQGTYNRPTLDWEDYADLRNLQVGQDKLSFDLQGEADPLHVDLRWEKDSLLGTVKGAYEEGKITLAPTATLEKDYLDTLAGDYEVAGESFVIERENSFLCFLNRRTGQSGRLMPKTETEFWTGPTMDIWYPPKVWFEFVRGTGRPMRLKVRGDANQDFVGIRKDLYSREDVEFENAGAKLSGTLRIPPGSKPHPAVVLLHGSNYQTRGAQYAALAFVADQFARNGFIVLSYDKRGTGKSGGERVDDPELISGDAASAVRLLRNRKEVDPKRIGLWGLSQGGIIEPLVAAKAEGLAFFVNVSGAVVNTNQQEIQRTELQLRADGFSESDIKAAVHLQEVKFHYACKRDNWDEYENTLKAAQGKLWLPDPYIGPPDSKTSHAWDFWSCGVDPGKSWENVHAPVLYLQGEFETYSSPRENLARLEHAMQVAGNKKFEHKVLPGAEHSMFRARNGGEKEEPFLNTYVEGYFSLMTKWAERQVGSQ